MAIIDIDGIIDNIHGVEDTLSRFADRFFKSLQVLVDGEAPDPDADNADYVFTIPIEFYAQCYTFFQAYQATNDYNSYDNGYQPVLFCFDLSLDNGVLSIDNFQCLGKLYTGSGYSNMWRNLSDAQKADLVEQMKNYFTGNLEITSDYSTEPDVFTYSNGGVFNFRTRDHSDSLHFAYNSLEGVKRSTGLQVSMMGESYTPRLDTDTDLISPTYNSFSKPQYGVTYCQKRPFQMITRDESWAINWVTTNDAEHNYVDTHTTAQGTFKVYYGDNYLIYYIPASVPLSYNIIKNVTVTAANKINSDNPSATPIVIKTYDENKYGPVPPSPIENDNQEDGGNYNHAEFTKVYACTSEELNNLYQWMGGGAAGTSGTSPVTVPDSFDPMNRIVGLIGYPMIIDTGVGDETTFTFRNAANQTINTGWSTYKYGNFDREVDFGTVDIPTWEKLENGAPFLDYSATVEIYIPFCGIVGLDPQAVMGCTLSCKMWIDFITGDCSAVVYTNYGGEDAQHPVAFVSGNCGSAEVVSANAFGAYQGAKAQASHKMSQAILGGFKDLATSVIGGATTGFTRGAANPSGAGGSAGMRAGAIGSVIGGAMNLGVNLTLQNLDNRYAVQVAKNALGTTISGSFGQQTSWYYMDTPYIKVTWPTPISKDVELYGKTFGVPVHRSGALSEFTGYTVCNNVDVSGIADATASELAIIKQFLETGVFIKEGGEE